MKRIIFLFAMVAICLSVFVGCKGKENIPFEYTREILIDKELPDKSLVWAGVFETPIEGVGMFESPDDTFFGIVNHEGIRDIKEVFSYEDGAYIIKTASFDDVCKVLGISIEELCKKFYHVRNAHLAFIWEDVVLYHFEVSENNSFEGKPTEFAGKYVFIEYREKTEEVYIQTLSPEEYNGNTDASSITSSRKVRIGDRYYLSKGYYDFTDHIYKLYSDESELPKNNGFGFSDFESGNLFEILKADTRLWEEIAEDASICGIDYINNRIYTQIVSGNAYYESENGELIYNGSERISVMLDAETHEILYAEKFYSPNYNIGIGLKLYYMSDDGILYEPYSHRNEEGKIE